VKVSGNPATCRHLADHLDVDVSDVLTRGASLGTAGRRIVATVRKVADGQVTCGERTGYDRTLDIYTRGPFV
jgi:(2R)-sulfolactate sulfo-lyase subunit beta